MGFHGVKQECRLSLTLFNKRFNEKIGRELNTPRDFTTHPLSEQFFYRWVQNIMFCSSHERFIHLIENIINLLKSIKMLNRPKF